MSIRTPHLSILAAGAVALMITVAFLASAGDAGAAPNLVLNGGFDTDTSNWTAQSDTTISQINTDDADSLNPTSGALVVSDDSLVVNDAIATSDCIVLTGAGSYDIAASYKATATASGAERVQVIVTVFDDAACSTNPVANASGQLVDTTTWQQYTNSVVVTTELSAIVEVTVEGATDVDDAVQFDNIALSNGPLDTPTPTNTATETATSTATNTPTDTATPTATATPTDTSTPAPTDTPAPTSTNTPIPTDTPTAIASPTDVPADTATPVPTNTTVPTATNTTVPPPTEEGAPPQAEVEDSTGGAGGLTSGDDGVSGEEAPEGELPEDVDPAAVGALGYGPQSRQDGGSNVPDVVATLAFGAAIAMLGLGFALQRKTRDEER